MQKPDLSVVMGTWNRKEQLRQAVAEARRSAGSLAVEVIVVDGGSTDGSLEWLDTQDVLVVKQDRLKGATRAYNPGFRLAQADLVAHINDDDICLDNCMTDGFHYMREHPEVGQVCFVFDGWREGNFQNDVVFGNPYCNKGITRRHLGDRCGWWDERFHTYAADAELSCRIRECGFEVVGLPQCRIHDLKTRDELAKRNNEDQRGGEGRETTHPDSKLFYEQRKSVEMSLRDNRVLHVALNTARDSQPALERALRSLGTYRQLSWMGKNRPIDAELEKVCEEFQPDLVFMQLQTPNVVTPQCGRRLSDNATVVSWSGDVRREIGRWMFELGREIDFTLVTNYDWVEQLTEAGVSADYLQIGFNQEIYNPWGKEVLDGPPIVFMGNNYGVNKFPLSQMRYDMVMRLREEFGDAFAVYGVGWPFRTRQLDHEQEAAAYRGAKVAVGISQFDLYRYTSDRLFRAVGSGCRYLTKKYPGLEGDFYVGLHVSPWETLDEMVDRIHFYMEDSCKRETRAFIGMEYVHHDHTWLDRMRDLKEIIGWHPWR